jgi:cupin superfamily acireductone dioxygenase involved in methionine salvage
MTTHQMSNTGMPETTEKEIIAGHQARLREIAKNNGFYLNDAINPCPTEINTYEVSIKF